LPTSATTWLKDPSPSGWTCATPTAPTSPCSARSSACTRWPSKTHFDAVQSLDDCVEEIEDRLFDDIPHSMEVQRRSFQLRKSLVLLRRVVLPMREVVNAVMRRDLHVGGELVPYYQDVYDHVLRAAEWNDSLRDLVTSILETNVTIQGNRLNIITKKVTGWAAIIAVPTLITGYFGMNVPYPGFSDKAGFTASLAAMILAALVLYIVFKRKDWL
jgi:magnesium transporter